MGTIALQIGHSTEVESLIIIGMGMENLFEQLGCCWKVGLVVESSGPDPVILRERGREML